MNKRKPVLNIACVASLMKLSILKTFILMILYWVKNHMKIKFYDLCFR